MVGTIVHAIFTKSKIHLTIINQIFETVITVSRLLPLIKLMNLDSPVHHLMSSECHPKLWPMIVRKNPSLYLRMMQTSGALQEEMVLTCWNHIHLMSWPTCWKYKIISNCNISKNLFSMKINRYWSTSKIKKKEAYYIL